MNIVYTLLTLVAGALAPTQAGINAVLSQHLRSTVLAALVSFAVGTTALAIYALTSGATWPGGEGLGRTPWWAWSGGLCGAFLVAATIAAAPRLGAATMIAVFLAGQMLASLVLDHFGLAGFETHPVSGWRVLGAALVVTGVLLVRRF